MAAINLWSAGADCPAIVSAISRMKTLIYREKQPVPGGLKAG
jgi:hypothetical protein